MGRDRALRRVRTGNRVTGNMVTASQLGNLHRGVAPAPRSTTTGSPHRRTRTWGRSSPGRPGRSRGPPGRTSSAGRRSAATTGGSPSGTGFSETHMDANRDGFVDEPYPVIAGQSDLLPLASSTAPTPTPGPYRTLVVPGTIEAEDYDNGGEGVAYHDTVAGNQGGAYRSDDVDIEADLGRVHPRLHPRHRVDAVYRDRAAGRRLHGHAPRGGLERAADGPHPGGHHRDRGRHAPPDRLLDRFHDRDDHGPPRGRHPGAPVHLLRRRHEPGPDRDRPRHADGHADADTDSHSDPDAHGE